MKLYISEFKSKLHNRKVKSCREWVQTKISINLETSWWTRWWHLPMSLIFMPCSKTLWKKSSNAKRCPLTCTSTRKCTYWWWECRSLRSKFDNNKNSQYICELAVYLSSISPLMLSKENITSKIMSLCIDKYNHLKVKSTWWVKKSSKQTSSLIFCWLTSGKRTKPSSSSAWTNKRCKTTTCQWWFLPTSCTGLLFTCGQLKRQQSWPQNLKPGESGEAATIPLKTSSVSKYSTSILTRWMKASPCNLCN